MTPRRHSVIATAFVFVLSLSIPAVATAQTMGADDFEGPEEDTAPGEAGAAPPTSGAEVHPGDEAAPTPTVDRELEAGDATAVVDISHAADEDVDLSGRLVLLEAVQPPGPLQPDGDDFQRVVDSWQAESDETGVAQFHDLPDDLSTNRLMLRASVDYGGITFDSGFIEPDGQAHIDLDVYDRAHEYPGVRVQRIRVLISPWEDYLIFDQFWTLEIEGDRAFDISDSTDPALEDGLPIQLPYRAEGISVSGPGDHDVVDNIIFWNGTLQPNQPMTLQIRFSKSAHSSDFTFEQDVQYPVDNLDILATIDTDFEKVPRLDDLALQAPGFDVSNDPTEAGLPPHTTRDFLVATGRSVERGESYRLRLDGLPFDRPVGAWVSLAAGLLAALFLAFYGRREYRRVHQKRDDETILRALKERRDDLVDELTELEELIDETYDDDDVIDLEQEELLVRQQLQLVLRKIDELQDNDDVTDEAA